MGSFFLYTLELSKLTPMGQQRGIFAPKVQRAQQQWSGFKHGLKNGAQVSAIRVV